VDEVIEWWLLSTQTCLPAESTENFQGASEVKKALMGAEQLSFVLIMK